MILTITIDTSGREFCCGRAGAQVCALLHNLTSDPRMLAWSGHSPLDIPIISRDGRMTIIGRARAEKPAIETKSKPL